MHFVRVSLEKKRMNISLGEQIPALTWTNGTGKVGYSDDAMRANMGRGRKMRTLVSFVLHLGEMESVGAEGNFTSPHLKRQPQETCTRLQKPLG